MRFGNDTMDNYVGPISEYRDGEIIFEEDSAGGWVFVVAKGEVEVFKRVEGREIKLDRIYEGEVLGEVSFFDKQSRSASARAVGPVALMKFDDSFLEREYKKLPNAYRVILEAMALRLRRMMKLNAMVFGNPKILLLIAREMAKQQKGGPSGG